MHEGGVNLPRRRALVAAVDRRPGTLQHALDRHGCCVEQLGRLVRGVAQHVTEDQHRGLARDIIRAGGMLMSEVAIGAPIGRPDFARRNRIIAGLSEAVVVVEAPDRSGALLTASAATATGRELYAVPGQIDSQAARGCNRLIADHQAVMVTSVGALLRQIGLVRDVKAEPAALARIDPVLRAELDDSLERLNRTVDINQRALRAARAANERLMKLIVDAAAAQRPSVSAYGRNGVMAGRPTKAQPLSLTFDQRL